MSQTEYEYQKGEDGRQKGIKLPILNVRVGVLDTSDISLTKNAHWICSPFWYSNLKFWGLAHGLLPVQVSLLYRLFHLMLSSCVWTVLASLVTVTVHSLHEVTVSAVRLYINCSSRTNCSPQHCYMLEVLCFGVVRLCVHPKVCEHKILLTTSGNFTNVAILVHLRTKMN